MCMQSTGFSKCWTGFCWFNRWTVLSITLEPSLCCTTEQIPDSLSACWETFGGFQLPCTAYPLSILMLLVLFRSTRTSFTLLPADCAVLSPSEFVSLGYILPFLYSLSFMMLYVRDVLMEPSTQPLASLISISITKIVNKITVRSTFTFLIRIFHVLAAQVNFWWPFSFFLCSK